MKPGRYRPTLPWGCPEGIMPYKDQKEHNKCSSARVRRIRAEWFQQKWPMSSL